MSGGWKDLVINPNERALSTEINRLQTFKGADMGELWRALMNTDTANGVGDDINPGFPNQVTSANSPVAAEVIDGLIPQFKNATLDVSIQPGRCFMYDPDSSTYNGLLPNPDESQYKFINDPGLNYGALFMTANSSGQTRIDVIECARTGVGYTGVGYTVLETDNRDVFNPITGAFAAATVNKVIAGQLQYRVRQGTPGSGFPGTAQGWLPLAVAVVPNGTSTNAGITFYDVRPLVADRVVAPFKLGYQTGRTFHVELNGDNSGINGSNTRLGGRVDAVGADWTGVFVVPGTRRLGGDFSFGTWGFPDLTSAGPLFSAAGVTNDAAYLYLLEPFGLPRWCKYVLSGQAKTPSGPRGILCVSNVAPVPLIGSPSAAISLPTSTGLGGSTGMGFCVAALKYVAGVPIPFICDGRAQWVGQSGAVNTIYSSGQISGAGPYNFLMTPGASTLTNGATVGIPPNARAIYVEISLTLSISANTLFSTTPTISIISNGQVVGGVTLNQVQLSNPMASAQNMTVNATLKIPVPVTAMNLSTSPPSARAFTLAPALSFGTATVANIIVLGWDLA